MTAPMPFSHASRLPSSLIPIALPAEMHHIRPMGEVVLILAVIIGFIAILWKSLNKANDNTDDASTPANTNSGLTMIVLVVGFLVVVGFVITAGCGTAMSHH